MKKRPSKGVIYVLATLIAGGVAGYHVGNIIKDQAVQDLAQIKDQTSITAQRIQERSDLATYVLAPTGSVVALLTAAGIADATGKIKKSAYNRKRRQHEYEDEMER